MRKAPIVILLAAVLAGMAWLIGLPSGGASTPETKAPGERLPHPGEHQRLPAAVTTPPAGSTPIRLQLPPAEGNESDGRHEASAAALLTGTVTRTEDGRLLPGIDVALHVDDDGTFEKLHAVTDGSGRYTLELPAPCFLEYYVIDVGSTSTHTWGSLDREVLPGDSIDLDLQVAGGAELHGRVVDASGRAIRGALVRGWITAARVAHAAPSTWGKPDRSATSDADGRFTLLHLGPEFMIDATAPGMICSRRLRAELSGGVLSGDLTLVLRPARNLSVSVVDTGGAPVTYPSLPDALTVDAEPVPYFLQPNEEITPVLGVFREVAARQSVTLGAHGEAQLSLGPGPWQISVDHPDYPLFERVHKPGDENPMRIVLGLGADVEVRVRDVGGRPIVGAEVTCGPLDSLEHRRHVLTNGAGHARLEGLDSGGVQIFIRAEGFAWGHAGCWDLVTGETRLLDVTLEESATLRLRVVDAEAQPVPDITVRVEGESAASRGFGTEATADVYRATSDAEGRVALHPLRTGLHVVRLRSPRSGRRFGIDLALEANGVEHVVVMDTSNLVQLTGVVTDALTGDPVPDFQLATRTIVSGMLQGLDIQHIEDAGGQWSLEQLAGNLTQLSISAEGYAPVSLEPIEVWPGLPPLDIQLFAPRSLDVRVTDVQGRPVTARAQFTDLDSHLLNPYDGAFYGPKVLFTDGNGFIRANGLPAMRIQVQVTSWSLGVDERQEIDLTHPVETALEFIVTPSAFRDALFVVLGSQKPISPSGSPWQVLQQYGRDAAWPMDKAVTVRVLADDDSLVSETHFSAAEAGAHRAFASRRPGMSWRMPTVKLPAEPLRLVLSAEGYQTITVRWEPGGPGSFAQDTLVIVLPRS